MGRYQRARTIDIPQLLLLAGKLWPHATAAELKREFVESIRGRSKTVIVLRADDQTIVAFIILSIRNDYVEGSSSSPVAYVEGIFVDSRHRRAGIGRDLIGQAERWAKSHKCRQLASDTEIHNRRSRAFHQRVGFTDANHVVCYIKNLGEGITNR